MQRYAITHLGKDGLRTLTFANQGRNHYDNKADAQEALEAFRPDLRAKVLHELAGTLEVRQVECYDHGDAIGIYFPTNMQLVTGRQFDVNCCQCGGGFVAGDGREVYADLEGQPWKAYYCATCAGPALELARVERPVK